jgi:hypothetical protein
VPEVWAEREVRLREDAARFATGRTDVLDGERDAATDKCEVAVARLITGALPGASQCHTPAEAPQESATQWMSGQPVSGQ